MIVTVLAVALFVLVGAAGIALLIWDPPMPPPSPETQAQLDAMSQAFHDLGRQLGEALIAPMTRVADAASRLVARRWPLAHLLPRPSDPNPFPKFHLFRRRPR